MIRSATPYRLLGLLLAGMIAVDSAKAQDDGMAGFARERGDVPTLSPAVEMMLDDDLLTDAQRNELAIFHGQYDRVRRPSRLDEAKEALARWELSHPLLVDDHTPVMLRAQAALHRGEAQQVIDRLKDEATAQAALLRASAQVQLGDYAAAIETLTPWRKKLQFEAIHDAVELTAATKGVLLLAQLEGRPSEDYQLALRLLAKARSELDRLYWPAYLAEAQLLAEKGNGAEALKAAEEGLRLNPNAAEAWRLIGESALDGFDFPRVQQCIEQIRKNNADHLLATLLEARLLLTKGDSNGALTRIESLRRAYPKNRELLALRAAAKALLLDQDAFAEAMVDFDALSPGGASACFTAADFLARHDQYESAERLYRQALERQPNWPAAQVSLGLLLMQSGREQAAHEALKLAVQLDAFNLRAANQFKLVKELLTYERRTTPHFVIQYKAGVDEVLARDMTIWLEDVYPQTTEKYGYEPAEPMLIEIMPDREWLAVRLAGLPEIETKVASTGRVIVLTPPRSGLKQVGAYDWLDAVQERFTDSLILQQTGHRSPAWFKRGCAQSDRLLDRRYETNRLLATALNRDALFSLDQLDNALILRDNLEGRILAEAQSRWMLEYLTAEYGREKIVALLGRFSQGIATAQAFEEAIGAAPDAFMQSFKQWGGRQVKVWGLEAPEPISELSYRDELERTISEDRLVELLSLHPNHPDLLKLRAARAMQQADPSAARRAVRQYQAVRPTDDWSHRQLIALGADTQGDEPIIAALQQLDRRENLTGQWAYELAKQLRRNGELESAASAVWRALHREPYNGTYRELAAAIELQLGRHDVALHHLINMTLLEPNRAIHFTRLAALHHRLGDLESARRAAERALSINPEASVSRYLEKAE